MFNKMTIREMGIQIEVSASLGQDCLVVGSDGNPRVARPKYNRAARLKSQVLGLVSCLRTSLRIGELTLRFCGASLLEPKIFKRVTEIIGLF